MPKWSFIHENGRSPPSPEFLRKSISTDWRSISVPFPPNINPMDLVKPRKDGKPRKRCANYFLIYRIQFAEALRANGYNLPLMTDISMMAGDAWSEEPEFVRYYYKKVANEVKELHDNLVRSAMTLQSEISPLQFNISQNFDQVPQNITNGNDYSKNIPNFYDLNDCF